MKRLLLILITLLTLSSNTLADGPDDNSLSLWPIIDRLWQDGFEQDFLFKVFMDKRVELNPSLMTVSMGTLEVQDIYNKFLTPQSIELARVFLRENRKILRRMEKHFLVDKEVVVAILLVESRFGENIGKHRVIPTLASMALTDSPVNMWNNYELLRQADPELSADWLEERARKRARWAYNELKCFLRIIREEKVDPLEVRGSYAGALGMAQFIPSSYLAFAHSKTGLGVWLFSKEEAILSIANYFKSHGWRRKLSLDQKRKLIWYYNHSKPYVDTILEIAGKLKG